MARKTTPGVLYRHSRNCKSHETCTNKCNDSTEPWEAWVFDAKFVDPKTGSRGKKIRERFATHAAAKGWRTDAAKQVNDRTLRATVPRTLRQEIDEWLAGAETGSILNKRKQKYKPAVIRNYKLSLRLRVTPTLGDRQLKSIELRDLLELQEQLQGAGRSASVIRNTFVPLQAIFRRARRQGIITMNPAVDLELPTAGSRERAATPEQARGLLAAFDEARTVLTYVDKAGEVHETDYRCEVAILATAFYAGLRRGELRALRVSDVDLEAGQLRVERGWDDKEGAQAPKSRAGRRTVFVLDVLKPYLEPLVEERGGEELVFGSGPESPFDSRVVARRTDRARTAVDKARRAQWEEAGAVAADEPAPIERFTLHEARHSFSTWMEHSGVSDTRADRYMGHSSGKVAGRYRHQLPEQFEVDRHSLDAYLSGVASGKVAQLAVA